ncbi:MAG: ribosome assembly RNA-binding protein YhbY [Leptothrix sp. (in: Bacteria)]|nr:ribosome assembly RNA-binding protein YhbY [Leptothrix sp. (in: b-proteobacteria)]
MPALHLSPAERKQQRSLAHHLHPVVLIGGDGLTPAVLKEADAALSAHGLIKVRVFVESRDEREALLVQLADRLGAAPVQHIGKLLVLWRPLPQKDKPAPEGRLPAPRTVKLVTFSRSPHHRPTVKKVRVLGNQRVTAGGTIKRAKRRGASLKKRSLG